MQTCRASAPSMASVATSPAILWSAPGPDIGIYVESSRLNPKRPRHAGSGHERLVLTNDHSGKFCSIGAATLLHRLVHVGSHGREANSQQPANVAIPTTARH